MAERIGDINKLFPVKFDTDGMPLCRGCGKRLPHKSRRWCSKECNDNAMIKCYPSWARGAVESRDHGVCAQCGLDTKKLKRVYSIARGRGIDFFYYSRRHSAKFSHPLWATKLEKKWPWIITRAYSTLSFWEAHHKHAVKEGGGLCGLDNYETLCRGCHIKTFKKHSKSDA